MRGVSAHSAFFFFLLFFLLFFHTLLLRGASHSGADTHAGVSGPIIHKGQPPHRPRDLSAPKTSPHSCTVVWSCLRGPP